ncbi:class I fructose-bisphosphate aldolase [Sporomusa sphaeroides]|uniref:Aldolase LsrF n=1 Tax=Sporomusa sphaeroides DSM 2875 TaxID=1337886 RepID=A0ABM9W2G4_9FIRM|nr:hypothetical protein [Sporomusa sphaeroides]OLS56223.1 putative aldolase LsrF [Sporomusa sphaeroides DSM 2875]CVK19135.1 putative aldolase LsrF [Sporomusa sphaeroides DSM 2875]
MSAQCGKAIRLSKIIKKSTQRSVSIAFDHGLDDGPMLGNIKPRETMEKIIEGGADAVLISPGIARICSDLLCVDNAPAIILRLDWTNTFRAKDELNFEEGRNILISDVESALALGADAVLTFMFIGYQDSHVEALEIAKNAEVCRAAARVGIPHIMEPMARGNAQRANGRELDAKLIALHTRMAAEIGADAIKTDYSGDAASYAKVIEGCPVPIMIAGGPKTSSIKESLDMVKGAIDAGASGVVLGRNVVQAKDPVAMIKALRSIVHNNESVDYVIRHFNL